MTDADWQQGDLLGHDFPVHLEALREAGPAFLTNAFRSTGVLGADNSVAAITALEPFAGGSTGRKAILSVTYERAGPALPENLFVKFSRDLDDELRDRGKRQMESEVRFGLLSQIPDFPVAVPGCLFGEYHLESGSGILISEKISFGTDGVEPLHLKACDHALDEPRAHYDALISALARLAGSERAGRFPEEAMAHFTPRPMSPKRSRRPGPIPEQARDRVARYADFAARVPQILPASIRSDAFISRLSDEVHLSVEHDDVLRAAAGDTARELTAFCHWNANIDNAWFWRNEHGDIACGLMDWGNVGQMNVVTAIASCLTFAEPDFVIENLDHFFALFAAEFEGAGGGTIDPAALRLQYEVHMVTGGLQWPLGAVSLLERHVPELETVADRFDPRIAEDEFARTQLHLLTGSLVIWSSIDVRGVVDRAIRRSGGVADGLTI